MTARTDEHVTLVGEDGHLTEAALVLAADGHDLALPHADAHLGTCEACAARLVLHAALSVGAGEAMRLEEAHTRDAARPAARERDASTAPPWRLVFAALGVTFATLVPLVARLPSLAVRGVPALARCGPVLARGLLLSLAHRGQPGMTATFLSCALLILAGAVVSRSTRQPGVTS